jgi:hypothetical protein
MRTAVPASPRVRATSANHPNTSVQRARTRASSAPRVRSCVASRRRTPERSPAARCNDASAVARTSRSGWRPSASSRSITPRSRSGMSAREELLGKLCDAGVEGRGVPFAGLQHQRRRLRAAGHAGEALRGGDGRRNGLELPVPAPHLLVERVLALVGVAPLARAGDPRSAVGGGAGGSGWRGRSGRSAASSPPRVPAGRACDSSRSGSPPRRGRVACGAWERPPWPGGTTCTAGRRTVRGSLPPVTVRYPCECGS